MTNAIQPSETQKEEENDAGTSSRDTGISTSHLTAAKRTASSLSIEGTASQKRRRQNPKISNEEKRLVSGNHSSNPHATPIAVPANPWRTENTMSNPGPKRKVGAGVGFKATNTLNRPGIGSNKSRLITHPLDTAATAGDNVRDYAKSHHFIEPPPKRQKVDTTFPSGDVQVVIPWARDVGPPHLSRKPSSVITEESQESVRNAHSNDIFRAHESLNLNKMVGRQKKPRKPKGTSASNSQVDQKEHMEVIEVLDSQPSQTTRMGPPTAVPAGASSTHKPSRDDDDDDVEILDPRPAVGSHTSNGQGEKQPRMTKPGLVSRVQVPGEFDKLMAQNTPSRTREHPNQPTVFSKSATKQPHYGRSSSPALNNKFVRDNAANLPPPAKPNIRQRMLAVSKPSGTAATAEGSEDELAHVGVVAAHTKGHATNTRRPSGSPGDLRPTTFTSTTPKKRPKQTRHEFNLASIHTLSLEKSLIDQVKLIYSSDERAFTVDLEHGLWTQPDKRDPYLLNSKHARTMWVGRPQEPFLLGVEGAVDDMTGGRVWFEFRSYEDMERCSELVKQMVAPNNLNVKSPDQHKIVKVFEEALAILSTLRMKHVNLTDPELQAMKNRAAGRAATTQDRASRAHAGISPSPRPLDVTPTQDPRKDMMQGEFTSSTSRSELHRAPVADRRSTRTSTRLQIGEISPAWREPAIRRWTQENPSLRWDAPLVYPATGPKRTTVEAQDIERLDDGEFLNDNIISFCLRQLEEENSSLKDKVHIFNTFFYTSLSTKQGKRGFNYDAVKRWTKNIDIFTFPFVVVPVNVNLHWFVTIICNLDKLDRKFVDDDTEEKKDSDSDSENEMLDNKVGEDNEAVDLLPSELPDSQEEPNAENIRAEVGRLSISDGEMESTFDVKQADEDSNVFEFSNVPDSGETTSKASKVKTRKEKRKPPPAPKFGPDQPTIIILDSLGGTHGPETKNLKDYIVEEGKEKRGMAIDRQGIKGTLAKGIPEQTNFCDCGVYLVGYITEFLKDPPEFVRKVLSRELDKNNDFADFNPSNKRAHIRDKLLELEREQSEARRKKKKADREAKMKAEEGKRRTALPQLDGTDDGSEISKESTKSVDGTPAPGRFEETGSSPNQGVREVFEVSAATSDSGEAVPRNKLVSDDFPDELLAGIQEAAQE